MSEREEAVERMAEAAWNRDAAKDGLTLWEDLIYSEDDEDLVAERCADATAALDALLAFLEERGMQVVPKVATTWMLAQANTSRVSSGALFYTHLEAECLDEDDLRTIVNTALAASPNPLSRKGPDHE